MMAIVSICTLVTAGATCLLLLWRRRYHRIMGNLIAMLDAARDGTFQEQHYDESLFSAVESKLNEYLSASQVSQYNLAAEKDKIKALISDISHQTKTPIANLLLYTQLLEEQDLPPEGRTCVGALHSEAEKLNFLIAALVKLSRLETGVLTVRPQRNDLQPMVEEVCTQLAPKARQRDIALSFQPTDAQALFDYKWTGEALSNLVDNAIKYTPFGGRVHISVTPYELFCRIDVRDTGIGISEEEQPRVFARFYRCQAVADREGLGIGLYLVRQILTEQSGYIRVDSQVGRGSVFSIFLPR